jgi:hypothetical protein
MRIADDALGLHVRSRHDRVVQGTWHWNDHCRLDLSGLSYRESRELQ